jgi:hypothetical protein
MSSARARQTQQRFSRAIMVSDGEAAEVLTLTVEGGNKEGGRPLRVTTGGRQEPCGA